MRAAESLAWICDEAPNIIRFSAKEIGAMIDMANRNTKKARPLVFCSLNIAEKLRQEKGALCGGLFYRPDMMCAKAYMPYLPNGMALNEDHIFVSFGSIKKMGDRISRMFDGEDLFIRPDSGRKVFTGQTLSSGNLMEDVSILGASENITIDTLCLISSAKKISSAEWRCWMISGVVSAIAPYSRDNGGAAMANHIATPKEISRVATWTAEYMEVYDDALVVDLVETKNGVRIVEINAPSTSGIYPGCDLAEVITDMASLIA